MFKELIKHQVLFVLSVLKHLQRPGEARPTRALPAGFIAGRSVSTLAGLQTAPPVGPSGAGVLTEGSDEARRALTGPGQRVAEGPALTLTVLKAARTPVFGIAVWKQKL